MPIVVESMVQVASAPEAENLDQYLGVTQPAESSVITSSEEPIPRKMSPAPAQQNDSNYSPSPIHDEPAPMNSKHVSLMGRSHLQSQHTLPTMSPIDLGVPRYSRKGKIKATMPRVEEEKSSSTPKNVMQSKAAFSKNSKNDPVKENKKIARPPIKRKASEAEDKEAM